MQIAGRQGFVNEDKMDGWVFDADSFVHCELMHGNQECEQKEGGGEFVCRRKSDFYALHVLHCKHTFFNNKAK